MFDEKLANVKELVVEAVKNDITVGTQMVQVIRGELMQLIDHMNAEIASKHFKHVNKFDSYTLTMEGRLGKIGQEIKKIGKLAEKVAIQGPSQGIYMAHGT